MASCNIKSNLYIYLNFNAKLLNVSDKIQRDMFHFCIRKVAIGGFLFFTRGYPRAMYIHKNNLNQDRGGDGMIL